MALLYFGMTIDVSLINYLIRHIHVRVVAIHSNNSSWCFSSFYCHSIAQNQMDQGWDLIRSLSQDNFFSLVFLPLYCWVTSMRYYLSLRSNVGFMKQIEDFHHTLLDWGLCDMGYKGFKFTWCNK